jgi:hypothetical protein
MARIVHRVRRMDSDTDVVLGSITWRKIGDRWIATVHSSEGFITIESSCQSDALDYAMVASFLVAPLPSGG